MSDTKPRARSPRRLQRWLRVVLVGLALFVLVGLVLPRFLDMDRYRTLIASVIEDETGHKVNIGKIRARLLPSVGFVVQDFRLSNPPGFAEGAVLSVETIRGNLAWGPLLHRELHLSSVELVRPKLVLLEDDRGRTNFARTEPGSRPGERLKATDTPRAPIAGQSIHFAEIKQVDLIDAELTLARVSGRDHTLVPSLHARNIRAELSHVALDPMQPKQWQGEARLDGVQLEFPAWKEPIAFRSGRLRLREGHIESEFQAALGKAAEVKGRLRVADIERGVVSFDLTTSRLDLEALLASRAETTSPAALPTQPGRSTLVAQGRLAAERIDWQPYVASKGSAEIRIFTERIELWPFSAELYGGTLQISARLDRTQSPEHFSSNVQVRNLDVGKMLAASPATRGKLSGTGEVNLQLFGSLSPDSRKSLSGTGHFAVREGRLPGVNLAGALQSLAHVVGVGGETPFNLIEGDLTINQGRVWSRLIHMDSPHGTMDLHGSAGLDGALDYDGQIVLVPGTNPARSGVQNPADAIAGILGGVFKREVGRVTLPLSIRGTFRDTKVLPGPGRPSIESPAMRPPAAPAQPPKKSILDIFRRP